MNVLDVFLGIMSAIGGNVDMGQLVFTIEGGARFGFMLLWVVAVGSAGIILFSEMSGRVAVVTKKPAFTLIREETSRPLGLAVLAASTGVNVLTCTANIGGAAIVMQLLFGGENRMMMVAATALLLAVLGSLELEPIERIFGLMGLGLVLFIASAVSAAPDWGRVASGLLPRLPAEPEMPGTAVYAYYVVGLFSAILMPYEVHFYSSGAVEQGWTPKQMASNFSNSVIGFALGGVLTAALIVSGAMTFYGSGVDPHLLGTAALPVATELGAKALLVALLGMLFAVGGAAAETALANGYSIAQYFQRPWGKNRKLRDAPVFHAGWMGPLVAGLAIALTGVPPVEIVEYSVIFAVVVLPFTYWPILRMARDRKRMGAHANGPVVDALGWIFLALLTAAALAAIPLMVLTHMGEG
jgi:Mn2+/Fe2+ NRAMP family transporter